MSRFELRLPDIGEGVTEGEIVNWLVEVGDTVAENQDLLEVMTDKATVTIPSPRAGRVVERRGEAGSTVRVGEVLAVLEAEAAQEVARPDESTRARSETEVFASAVGDLEEELPGVRGGFISQAGHQEAASTQVDQRDSQAESPTGRPLASPATRRLARELGVNLSEIASSSATGRITREDVERFAARRGMGDSSDEARAAPTGASDRTTETTAMENVVRTASNEERIPIRGLRRRIYENMARSKRTAAHFTYVEECDAGELIAWRARLRPLAEAQGVRLTYLPFVIKAVVVALGKHPTLNAIVDDARQELVLRRHCDIGIAVATEAGLVVPVLRGAERRSLLDLAREIERLGERARAGKLEPEDLGGSSFTITSLGRMAGLLATPVVNYPEVAILGVHEIKRRPVVRGDSIAIGEIMLLSLSCDHRVVDGHVAAAFTQEVRACLEQPDRLMLSMV